MNWQERLKGAHLKRAKQRQHRPCKKHGRIRQVCPKCVQMFCPRCKDHDCKAKSVPQPAAAPTLSKFRRRKSDVSAPSLPDEALRPIWDRLHPMGAILIEKHVDSGEWMAVFPYQMDGYNNSTALGDAVYAKCKDVLLPTPYRSGRLNKPDRWFVSFSIAGG